VTSGLRPYVPGATMPTWSARIVTAMAGTGLGPTGWLRSSILLMSCMSLQGRTKVLQRLWPTVLQHKAKEIAK
jgi:hypothetical protein